MHAILTAVGTDGDVLPYVALGHRLRARGHRATLVADVYFQTLAVRHGLEFRSLFPYALTAELIADANLWHPLKGARVASAWGLKFIAQQYALLSELSREPDSVLVASPGVFAARLVQEKLGRPLATVLLQPGVIPSSIAPPVMVAGLTLPQGAPPWVGRGYWRLLDVVGHLVIGRSVNRMRATLHQYPVRRIFRWWLSPELVIGLFPPWYGAPQRDWPPQVRLAGFPLFDGGGEMPPGVLDFCRAGEPPIAFTLGTGMVHSRRFFRAALEACQILGSRGLLLTRYPAQLPSPLPASILHATFAPFLQLLPHCAAVVHHGGVGTVAKALATATPQLVLPLGWDQPDNAMRVRRLGVGDWLPPRRRTGAHLAAALRTVMTPATRDRCRAVAARFENGDALDTAADWIVELARSRSGS